MKGDKESNKKCRKGLERVWVVVRDEEERLTFVRNDLDYELGQRCVLCDAYWNDKLIDSAGEVRVVPYPWPIFEDGMPLEKWGEGELDDIITATGAHEAVIFTPKHTPDLTTLTNHHYRDFMKVVRRRAIDLERATDPETGEKKIKYLSVFFNQSGARKHKKANGEVYSGKVGHHIHGQIIGAPFEPSQRTGELAGAYEVLAFRGWCKYCNDLTRRLADTPESDLLRLKPEERNAFLEKKLASAEGLEYCLRKGKNILIENDTAVAYVLWGGNFPFKILIIPKQHFSTWDEAKPEALDSIGDILYDATNALTIALGNMKLMWNMHFIFRPDVGLKSSQAYHAHIDLRPFSFVEGLEGSDIYYTPVRIEKTVEILRGALARWYAETGREYPILCKMSKNFKHRNSTSL